MSFPVIWLTGNTGAGKSTAAFGVQERINTMLGEEWEIGRRCVVLDGDEMRATISREEGLSAEDRKKHNRRVARLAKHLSEQGFLVLVSVIAPFKSLREELDGLCAPKWVYIKRDGLGGEDRPYEAPEEPDWTIDNNTTDVDGAQRALMAFILSCAEPR